MSARSAPLLIALFMTVGSACYASAPPPRAKITIELQAPPVASALSDAFRYALAALSEFKDPVLQKYPKIVLQSIFDDPDSISVLLADQTQGARSVLPELCAALRFKDLRNTRICDYQHQCRETFNADSPVIICNLNTFSKLTVLMLAIHDESLLEKYMISDRGYMDLAHQIDTDPKKILETLTVKVPEDHLMQHLLYLSAFVLGHELQHLAKNSRHDRLGDTSFIPRPKQNDDPGASLATERICRNYLEFERHGLSLLGQKGLLSLAKVPLPADAKEGAAITKAAWAAEIDADEHASAMTILLIRKMVSAQAEILDDAVTEFSLQTLSTVAFYYWYERLGAFAAAACPEYREQSFFLTRCMCHGRERFTQAEGLYSDSHPVLYLRVIAAIERIFGKDGIKASELSVEARDKLFYRLTANTNLMEAPSKIALGACLLNNVAILKQTSRNFMDYPALEGFHGEVNPDFAGAPPDALRDSLLKECLAGENVK